MEILIDIGLLVQVLGVLTVLGSQVWFTIKSRKQARIKF